MPQNKNIYKYDVTACKAVYGFMWNVVTHVLDNKASYSKKKYMHGQHLEGLLSAIWYGSYNWKKMVSRLNLVNLESVF